MFDRPFRRCHANLRFLVLFMKTKIYLYNESIYRVTCDVSGKAVANSRKYESPNLPIFTKKCMPGGQPANVEIIMKINQTSS